MKFRIASKPKLHFECVLATEKLIERFKSKRGQPSDNYTLFPLCPDRKEWAETSYMFLHKKEPIVYLKVRREDKVFTLLVAEARRNTVLKGVALQTVLEQVETMAKKEGFNEIVLDRVSNREHMHTVINDNGYITQKDKPNPRKFIQSL